MHKSTVSPYVCEYDNDGEHITAPGKFQGEPVFAPAFWDAGLSGLADDDTGTVYRFKLGPDDFAKHLTLKAWMGRKRTLCLSESEQGFVHCFTR